MFPFYLFPGCVRAIRFKDGQTWELLFRDNGILRYRYLVYIPR